MSQHMIKTGKHEYPELQDEVKKALCASTKDGGTDEPRTQLLLKGVVSNITLKEISESGWILAYGKPYRYAIPRLYMVNPRTTLIRMLVSKPSSLLLCNSVLLICPCCFAF